MNRERTLELATAALHAALRDDWPAAQQAVQALGDLNDGSLMYAILAWCDTCLASQGISRDDGLPARVIWHPEGTTDLQAADDVTPEVRWAGQLLNARAADDEAMFLALANAVPDGFELGRHVGVLLHCVATTLRMAGAA